MSRPIKQYKCGNIGGAVWFNEREVNGNVIGFKTVSIRRVWMDKEKEIWRDETLNLRKQDIPKLQVILNKVQEDLLLAEPEKDKGNKGGDDDE